MHWLDPDYLPKVSGTFECFLLDPHGPKGETRRSRNTRRTKSVANTRK
jgi:hypothetical protein